MTGAQKDVLALLRKAQQAGLTVEKRRTGHYFVTDGTGAFVTAPGSATGRRAVHTLRKKLRTMLGVEL